MSFLYNLKIISAQKIKMESVEEQDEIQSHKSKSEYLLPNYPQINYYQEKYITIPYENISNQNQFQAITKVFNIDNQNPNILDFTPITNQQIIKQDETSFNNIIHKEKEITENEILINNSLNKETNSENNINGNKFQTGRWSEKEHQKFIEGILRYGNEWKNVQNIIKTRSSTQARSHAQKFFLRLRKTIPQESFNNHDKIFKYIIGSCDKNENNIKLSQEQKDKLMSVIKSNLRTEENINNISINKSDKDILKNGSGLDELNEDEEEDNLGYNKQPESEIFGLQKKMSCDLEINKKRKITFCSRKRRSSNDMSFNSNFNKIFDIKKDINKRSVDLTNENNFILNTSQQIVDNDKNKNNNNTNTNTNNNKTKNIIFNPNPNFIVNKNYINNSFLNKDSESFSQTDLDNIKGKKTNIIIHNTIYNFFISDENNNKTDTNRNNNKFNANNKNKLNNYQNDNSRTVIFKTAMKPQKSNNQNTNSNENEITQTQYNINYILRNKNFFPENTNNNFNQENIFNNSNNFNITNNINNNINNNNNKINEAEQCNPFDINFVNISYNDKKIEEGYFNNNNNDYNERIQTLSDKEKGYTFINEQ